MKPLTKFLALLVPYVVFVAAAAVIGSAFVIPETVFETIGDFGLVVAIVAATVSLFAMVKTSGQLRSLGHEVNAAHRTSER